MVPFRDYCSSTTICARIPEYIYVDVTEACVCTAAAMQSCLISV